MFFIFWFLVGWLVFCGGENRRGRFYRKRSRPKECAGVERKGMTRDMERKRECGAIRAKQGDGSDESLHCVDGLETRNNDATGKLDDLRSFLKPTQSQFFVFF